MSFKDEVNFCLNFIKIQDSSNQPCIYSPVSLLNSLAMIYTGSDGNTADEIVNVIGKESDDIHPDTGVVLVNAIYFIGKWATPFHERHKGMFYSKIPREIDLMCRTFMFINYTKGEDWECVGLPYKDNKVWMFILLPKEKDGLPNLINKMDYSMFMECTKSNVTPNRISVTMPVFEVSTDYDLKQEFPKLGIHDIFVPNVCNLSKMIAGKRYFVDKALHKAVIKVDEYGTEAAAATVNIMMPCSMPKSFRADHPFMYFIVSADRQHKQNNEEIQQQNEPFEILFAGTFC